MKPTIHFFLGLLLLGTMQAALAENKPAESKPANKDRFEMMAERMGLNAEQKKSLKPLVEKLKKERADTLRQLEESETRELSKILNPQQTQQVQRMIQRSAAHGRKGPGMKKGPKPGKSAKHEKKQAGPLPRPPKAIDK